ncbi:H-2 class II histocompatibility antigen, E-D beta chain-like [Rhineura floridana]|uniref:H-2 class II histocompatibility antigen, E-D beta chain-like n=1 Tax=Rhineura floridana TaxID=261503 RepID=UPI002AC873FD|nr:H-2 class II histocompatibility antigen, E-D beta chain-like [Rhineura floridana]
MRQPLRRPLALSRRLFPAAAVRLGKGTTALQDQALPGKLAGHRAEAMAAAKNSRAKGEEKKRSCHLPRFPGSPTGVNWVLALRVDVCQEKVQEHFLFQAKPECHFSASSTNGTLQRIHYLQRYFWDWQELLYFDSDQGRFVAMAELGKRQAEYWNKDKAFMRDRRAAVESFCRPNYGILEGFSSRRKTKIKN